MKLAPLTLIGVALDFKIELMFKTILHHDAFKRTVQQNY